MRYSHRSLDLSKVNSNTNMVIYDIPHRHDLLYHFIINIEIRVFNRELLKIIKHFEHTRVGTLIVATIYLQLIQNRYMLRSFTVLHCSHQHCVQPVASDVEVVGYL